MTTGPDDIRRTLAAAACRDTIARAARLTDLNEHEAFAELFTQDAQLQRPGGETLHGRAAIVAAYRARPPDRITRHLVGSSVVDLLADDEARAVSMVLLWSGHRTDAAGPFGRPAQGPAIVGEFDDLLRRETDGRWRIARRQASFVLHSVAPAG